MNNNKTFVWHIENDDRTCPICMQFAGKVYEKETDIPAHAHHKNCRCWIETINKNQNTRKSDIINNTITEEGGYIDNLNKIDQPTNAGITLATLNQYKLKHPTFNFPDNLKNLSLEQIKQIYSEEYYDNRKINEIDNYRIANAIFDMGVMTNFKNVIITVQKTLNNLFETNLSIDGIIGNKTITALNNIPTEEIDFFMQKLKENRIKYLQKLSTWNKFCKGWIARTNRY